MLGKVIGVCVVILLILTLYVTPSISAVHVSKVHISQKDLRTLNGISRGDWKVLNSCWFYNKYKYQLNYSYINQIISYCKSVPPVRYIPPHY